VFDSPSAASGGDASKVIPSKPLAGRFWEIWASLSYETDKYSVGLFANNIFDKYAVVSVDQDRSRIGVNDGIAVRYYKQALLNPRTVGIEARIKY